MWTQAGPSPGGRLIETRREPTESDAFPFARPRASATASKEEF